MNSRQAYYTLKKSLYDFFWAARMKSWWFKPEKKALEITNTKFSIGIVTYVDRYSRFFKPLIRQMTTLFPDTEFIIAINGFHDQLIQAGYSRDISDFLSGFPNVRQVSFHRPQSLSKLWNRLILNSSFEKVLICNDDIYISPGFRDQLERSPLLNEDIALINRSWSHFIISKATVGKVGWFDERFPGVGNEDEDYECRLVHDDIIVKSFRVGGLKNVSFKTVNFSYGKDTGVVNGKYVKANKIFFDQKWDLSAEPAAGYRYVAILDAYARLRNGMQTPDFYETQNKSLAENDN